VLQVLQGQPDQQPMVVAEAAAQGVAELGELGAQPAAGQLGQHPGVALAGDQGRQHRPAGDAQDVTGDRVQLDAGVLQGLLDPLALGAVGLDEPLAVAGEIPQLADRLGRHEAAPQQAMLQQLAQPGRIADIGLAAGQNLDVVGVDQQQRKPALLQHIPDGLPVLAGGLHHHLGHTLGGQPVGQCLKARGEGRKGADLLASCSAGGGRDAHASDNLVLADVQAAATFHYQLHRHHLRPTDRRPDRCCARRGRPRKRR